MIIPGIDETGHAVLEQLGAGERRRNANVLAFKGRFVRIHAVKQERLCVRLVGKAARELERCMQMAVDQPRRCHRVPAVDLAVSGIILGDFVRFADGDDLAAVNGDRSIADDAASTINGNQPIDAGDDQIDGFHAFLTYLLSPT